MTRGTSYSEQALSANNAEFTPEGMEEAGRNAFARLRDRFGEQAQVQRNTSAPTNDAEDEQARPNLYVASNGFVELFADAARMTTLYGAAGRERADDVITDRKVDQAVLYNFGWTIDRAALAGGARSIQVDPATGHNPYKVYNRLQQVLTGSSPSTTHVISRRGDIYTLLPWSQAPVANASRSFASAQIESRSISIELEAWYTTQNIAYRGTREPRFRIVGLMPYTPQQYTAVAFLLKKLGLWSTTDAFNVLGFTSTDVSSKLGNGNAHTPGIVNAAAYHRNEAYSPGGEFELPTGWKLGDPLPPHLMASDNAEAWVERYVTLYFSQGFAVGTPLSAIDAMKSAAAAMPAYSFELDLFAPLTERAVFEPSPPTTVLASASEAGATAVGVGYARSQSMQSTPRARLYEAATVALDAAATAVAEVEARAAAQRDARVVAPATSSATCFDFALGQWGYQQVRIVPDPAGVVIPQTTTTAPPSGRPPT